MSFTFEPPSHEEPIRTDVRPLNYFRLTWANSVVRVAGVFTSIRTPSNEQLVAAGVEGEDYFIGGHIYQIDADTEAALSAAGFPTFGYGHGAYGSGPYGS